MLYDGVYGPLERDPADVPGKLRGIICGAYKDRRNRIELLQTAINVSSTLGIKEATTMYMSELESLLYPSGSEESHEAVQKKKEDEGKAMLERLAKIGTAPIEFEPIGATLREVRDPFHVRRRKK